MAGIPEHIQPVGPRDTLGIDNISEEHSQRSQWYLFGQKFPRNEIVFFIQVILVYIVVITSVVNLSMGSDDGKIWTARIDRADACLWLRSGAPLSPLPEHQQYPNDCPECPQHLAMSAVPEVRSR